jgi:flagellar protein FlaG
MRTQVPRKNAVNWSGVIVFWLREKIMTSISSTTGAPLQAASIPRTASAIQESTPLPNIHVVSVPSVKLDQVTKTSPPAKLVPSPEELQRITEELQHHISTRAPDLEFSVDESSGRSIMKFTDRTTNEVIQQFPSLEALQITKALDQFQRGLLVNRQV